MASTSLLGSGPGLGYGLGSRWIQQAATRSSSSRHGMLPGRSCCSSRGAVASCLDQAAAAAPAPAETRSSNAGGGDGSGGGEVGEVEGIVGSRRARDGGGGMEYLIRWADGHADSWEPGGNVAADVVAEYTSAWWQAARRADEAALTALVADVEAGRDVNAVEDKERTALHFVAGLGSEACVRLLAEAGAELDSQDADGFTALHIAAGYVHPGVVRALLEQGADPETEDSRGRTPVKLAREVLSSIPRANPLQLSRRLALEQVIKLLDECSYEVVPVEQIVDKRIAAGNVVEYLVRWADDVAESWLPAADIAADLVADFEAGLEYGVAEAVLDKRLTDVGPEYLVRWADSGEETWEPAQHVTPELIQCFEDDSSI